MGQTLNDRARQGLRTIFERGAADASSALSKWLGQPATLRTSDVEEVELADAAELLGPADELVAVSSMEILGQISGQLLLVFQGRSGLALVDLLLRQPDGTADSWGELEQSAANETANIVGCAYLNSLAVMLPRRAEVGTVANDGIVPSPPSFRHEFAGSLLEFALMEQASQFDRLLLIKTRFESDAKELDWSLLFVPSSDSLEWLAQAV